MSEKEYPVLEAARMLGIPRSVIVSAIMNGTLDTTLKFETVSDRQRAKHYVRLSEAKRVYQIYLDGEEEREARVEQTETGKKWAKPVDVYSHAARSRLEDLALLRELEQYGVTAGDVL